VTVVPAAIVMVVVGAGASEAGGDEGAPGGGGGFGVFALPLGAYEIRDGGVTWKPTGIHVVYALMVLVPVLRGVIALLRDRN
jgi:hypothetical protein